jgi:hypothetical protein
MLENNSFILFPGNGGCIRYEKNYMSHSEYTFLHFQSLILLKITGEFLNVHYAILE